MSKTVILYHGSKSGIHGNIAPVSRKYCDFGKGFYMGTERLQPLTLICNDPDARIYTLEADLSELKILDIEVGLEWALLVAYNRGKMEGAKNTLLYNHIANVSQKNDMVIGYIANDRMFVVLDRFFFFFITDRALINSLSALKLGKQYVALTKKACEKIKILDEKTISNEEREELKQKSEENRQEGIQIAERICREYRREGRFFDEILEEGK